VPLRRLLGAAGRFIPLGATLADGMLLNAANCEPQIVGRMAREAIDDIPIKLVTEIASQMSSVGAPNPSGPYGFEAKLGQIRAPIFALGGAADRVAPPPSVAAATCVSERWVCATVTEPTMDMWIYWSVAAPLTRSTRSC
jgi:hypothetical protein